MDDIWVSVGSTNFDDRSFRLNDEANLNALDPGFAREQARVFDEDRAAARSVWERFQERWARLVRSQR